MDTRIQEKLFQIVRKPARYKLHPGILLPESIAPIPEEKLFTSPNTYRILELGCGWGEFAIAWLENHPHHSYVAMEIQKERIKKLLKKIDRLQLNNIKILPVNFRWFYREIFPENCFHLIIINFPDPWPKRRHWKHRLINSKFLEDSYALLKHNGMMYIATDYGPYARKIIRLFRKSPLYLPLLPWPNYSRKRIGFFPESKFEKITSRTARPYYMLWRKV